jgi:hypothetical protein
MKANMHSIRLLALAALLASGLTVQAQAQSRSNEPEVGTALPAFEMSWAKRSPEEVAERLQLLAQVMTGKALRAEGAERLAAPADASWQSPFPDAPRLRARYLPVVDELRLLDEKATLNLTPKAPIDEPTALEIAAKLLEQLAEARLIEPRHYDIRRAQVGYHRSMAGPNKSDKPEVNQVTEYRITLRPALNGIEVATAGLRIGVHADGQVIGLRLGGASIASLADKNGFDLPTGEGRYLTRRLGNDELDQQFLKQQPLTAQPRVHWAKLMYAMPEGTQRAVVEPLRIYAYSNVGGSDGEEAVSRRKLVGFSLSDAEAKPLDYTAATPARRQTQRLK